MAKHIQYKKCSKNIDEFITIDQTDKLLQIVINNCSTLREESNSLHINNSACFEVLPPDHLLKLNMYQTCITRQTHLNDCMLFAAQMQWKFVNGNWFQLAVFSSSGKCTHSPCHSWVAAHHQLSVHVLETLPTLRDCRIVMFYGWLRFVSFITFITEYSQTHKQHSQKHA